MSEQLKKQTVTIFGETFTIVTDEPVERLAHAAGLLNEYLQQYIGHVEDRHRMLLLCALHAALETERFKEQLGEIKHKEQALIAAMDREINREMDRELDTQLLD